MSLMILVINGPNLNFLGKRNSHVYGNMTLQTINKLLLKKAKEFQVRLIFFQSNHEGDLIDFLQKEAIKAQGILINPGALTHYGYSLRDALADSKLPIIEVHLSNILKRENFRKIDVIKDVVIERVMGRKEKSYLLGLEKLINYLIPSTIEIVPSITPSRLIPIKSGYSKKGIKKYEHVN